MTMDNYTTIIIESNLDEADIAGRLLEKYVEGSTYNEETKIWSVPEDIHRKISKRPENSQIRTEKREEQS